MQKKIHLIKNYWLQTPEHFSENYFTSFRTYLSPTGFFLKLRREKVLGILKNIKGKKILDAGCGSGIFIYEFTNRGAYVTGIDYSRKMIDIARELLNENNVPKNKYKLIKSGVTKLPFKKHSFDIILATGLADYLSKDDNKKFIKEAERVIKKDGVLVISFPSKKSPVSFLRSGIGLKLRGKLMKLPPLHTTFTSDDVKEILKRGNFEVKSKTKIMATMWLIQAQYIKSGKN